MTAAPFFLPPYLVELELELEVVEVALKLILLRRQHARHRHLEHEAELRHVDDEELLARLRPARHQADRAQPPLLVLRRVREHVLHLLVVCAQRVEIGRDAVVDADVRARARVLAEGARCGDVDDA